MKQLTAILLLCLLPLLSRAQSRETDAGAFFAFELQKRLTRAFTLSVEEEIRLVSHSNPFDRNMLTVGADYAFFDRRLKVGASYCHIYLYNTDYYYEHRHRYYAFLSYKQPLGDFTLTWRGRFQGTNRDEERGEYRINPKYVLRNKLDLEYSIFGSPWTPFVSAEAANTLNDPRGNEIYRIRYQLGASLRLNRTDFIEFFLRFNHYLVDKDPNLFGVGVSYKIRLL